LSLRHVVIVVRAAFGAPGRGDALLGELALDCLLVGERDRDRWDLGL